MRNQISLVFVAALLTAAVIGCAAGDRGGPSISTDSSYSGPSPKPVARLKIGYLSIGAEVGADGKLKWDVKLSDKFSIGIPGASLEIGVKQALEEADETPGIRRLTIVVEDASGRSTTYTLTTEEKIDVVFKAPDLVRIIYEHGTVIVIIKNPRGSNLKSEQSFNIDDSRYFVKTVNGNGAFLRETREFDGATIKPIPENAEVRALERIDALEEGPYGPGRWFRVRHGTHEGWIWGDYLDRRRKKQVAAGSP